MVASEHPQVNVLFSKDKYLVKVLKLTSFHVDIAKWNCMYVYVNCCCYSDGDCCTLSKVHKS